MSAIASGLRIDPESNGPVCLYCDEPILPTEEKITWRCACPECYRGGPDHVAHLNCGEDAFVKSEERGIAERYSA